MTEHPGEAPRAGADDPIETIERKLTSGELSRAEVEHARAVWSERLRDGITMPNGEEIIVSERDLHHVLLDARVRRAPERIERLLQNIFEIRTAHTERRIGLAEWVEEGRPFFGYVILDVDGHLRAAHVTDARKTRKQLRQGTPLWRRDESPPSGKDQSGTS